VGSTEQMANIKEKKGLAVVHLQQESEGAAVGQRCEYGGVDQAYSGLRVFTVESTLLCGRWWLLHGVCCCEPK